MQSVLLEISRKIKKEMKDLRSDDRDSVLHDAVEAVKRFNWTTVMMEYEKMMPTLMTLLKQVVPKPIEHKPLLCQVASQILKSRHRRMGLVQRAVSIMLYGNGTNKQVCTKGLR